MWASKRRFDRGKDEVPEYWITYSDLMVSLLMVFALLFFLSLSRWRSMVEAATEARNKFEQAVEVAAEEAATTGINIEASGNTIVIGERVLFAFNSSALSAGGDSIARRLAAELLPKILANPAIDTLIQSIDIQGYTDTTGTYLYNLDLSQKRAAAVAQALLGGTAEDRIARVRQLVVASGRSENDPVYVEGRLDAARSRRIEIHFRLKTDTLLEGIATQLGLGPVR